jgi:RNA polymerase sigma-70 factor (ECF subfamily)
MEATTTQGKMETDKQATFKTWVAAHADILYSYAVHHGFHEEGAKDIVQETFLSAWRAMDGYTGKVSVKNWLFVILKSRISDHFRKKSNKLALETVQQEYNDHAYFDEDDHWREGVYPKEWQVNFSDPLEVKDFYKVFRSCSGKLKEIQNTVFIMKYVDEMDGDEICKDLGITASNYWVILHRAKVQLRACLEKNWLSK